MTSTASDPSGPARSAPDAHTAPLQAQQLPPDEDLIERADRCIAAALEGGALQPIRTEQDWLEEAGLRFSVRWVSSLALKDRARVDTVTRKRADFNPFLPPEAALTVAELGAYHRLVLNKFPVIERHLLVVTRDFEDQSEPLDAADLGALGAIMAAHGGLGFYNGGPVAGASQRHKHLQWVPASASRLGSFVPAPTTAHANAAGTVFDNPLLPWAHAFVRLDAALWNEPATLGAVGTGCDVEHDLGETVLVGDGRGNRTHGFVQVSTAVLRAPRPGAQRAVGAAHERPAESLFLSGEQCRVVGEVERRREEVLRRRVLLQPPHEVTDGDIELVRAHNGHVEQNLADLGSDGLHLPLRHAEQHLELDARGP